MIVWSKLSSAQWADAWEERLAGNRDLVITRIPGRKTVRIEVYCPRRREALAIQRQFGGVVRSLRACNWAAYQPEPPPPVVVRDALLISAESSRQKLAALAKSHPRRAVISIPPDMAFGTGHHATTATVLRLLVDHAKSQRGTSWSLCDLGTGSGVLAIAASKLGAAKVWACDHDPHALRVARQNVRRNRARGIQLEQADVLRWSPRARYDCVAANLFSGVLIGAFPKIARAVKPDGVVLVSGILKSQTRECLRAGSRVGLHFGRVITTGKWVTARAVRRR